MQMQCNDNAWHVGTTSNIEDILVNSLLHPQHSFNMGPLGRGRFASVNILQRHNWNTQTQLTDACLRFISTRMNSY
jgi:hypothetical protein